MSFLYLILDRDTDIIINDRSSQNTILLFLGLILVFINYFLLMSLILLFVQSSKSCKLFVLAFVSRRAGDVSIYYRYYYYTASLQLIDSWTWFWMECWWCIILCMYTREKNENKFCPLLFLALEYSQR